MPIVIIADDDKDITSLLKGSFRISGFEAHKAHSAEECIELVRKIGPETVAAVCMDGRIASDRSTMVIVNVKQLNPDINIFVVAERHLNEIKTRVLDYGANEFVLKPISLNSIVEKVNTLLLESATGGTEKRAGGLS